MTGAARWEVDHVFVAGPRGAPAMDALADAGFAEGPPNTHPGQGTACRRLFFRNLYLELIWLVDAGEAGSPGVRRTGLAARAGLEDGASRLGIAFRSAGPAPAEPPVRTWPYAAPYLPDGITIPVADGSVRAAEPLLFFMPWGRRWGAPRLPHPNGADTVTALTLTVRGDADPSPGLEWLRGREGLRVRTGPSEGLEIELDGGTAGRSLDAGAGVPITLAW